MYKLTENPDVVLTPKNEYITVDGSGWGEYQEWLTDGNIPDSINLKKQIYRDKKDAIRDKAERKREKQFTDPVSNKKFKPNLLKLLFKMNNGKTGDIELETNEKKADGEKYKKHTFKKNEFDDFVKFAINRDEAIDDFRDLLIDQLKDFYINPSTTVEQIENFDINSNWP